MILRICRIPILHIYRTQLQVITSDIIGIDNPRMVTAEVTFMLHPERHRLFGRAPYLVTDLTRQLPVGLLQVIRTYLCQLRRTFVDILIEQVLILLCLLSAKDKTSGVFCLCRSDILSFFRCGNKGFSSSV